MEATEKKSDGSFGNYHELKPKDTKVQLHRTQNEIKIILPIAKRNIYIDVLTNLGLLLLQNIPLVTLYSVLISNFLRISLYCSPNMIFLYLFTFLIIYFFLLLRGLWKIFKGYQKKVAQINITFDKVNAYNVFRIKSNKSPILTSSRYEILLLGYSPSCKNDDFQDNKNKRINRKKAITQPELFIYAGSNKYLITDLTIAEFWWIGQELSEFLNLELQIIYPTSKFPFKSSK